VARDNNSDQPGKSGPAQARSGTRSPTKEASIRTPNTKPASGGGSAKQPEQLARRISTPLLFFFVVGDILGSGIYALVGVIAGEVGGAIWASFLIAIAFAFLIGFSYAELVTKYPAAAGASLYVNRAFNNGLLTFLVAFSLVAAGLSAAGALAQVFGGPYFQTFLSVPTLLVAALFILALGLINFRGISESVRANTVMSLIELSGLAIILVIGAVVLFSGDADLGRPFEFREGVNPAIATLGGATLAFFALIGFENAVNVAEETQNPSRTYPRALFGGLLLASLLYLAISFTASMVVPTEQLAASEGALLEVVRQGPIPIPERLFSIIALVAVSNTALVALIMASRVLYGMAREGVLPRVLARTHRSRRTPWVAIVFTTLVALILLTTADVGRLADTTVVFILIVFLLVNTSVLVLRRDRVDHDHFSAPTVVPVLGIVACLILMVQIGINDIGVYTYAGVLLVVGLALYGLNALLKRRLDPAGRRG
jgi:basic amino acid/polyamine antiporter, APA family